MQLGLREAKKVLRKTMEWKETADAAIREQETRMEAKSVEVFELRVEQDNIANEQNERSKASLRAFCGGA